MNDEILAQLNSLIQGVWKNIPDGNQELTVAFGQLIEFLDENLEVKSSD